MIPNMFYFGIFMKISLTSKMFYFRVPRYPDFESYKGDFDGDFGSIRALARNMFEDESTVIPDLPSQREVERETLFETDSKFEDLNLHSYLNGNLKVIFGHEKPTMVQIKAIPPIQAGKDTLIRSQTGSGKVNRPIYI